MHGVVSAWFALAERQELVKLRLVELVDDL